MLYYQILLIGTDTGTKYGSIAQIQDSSLIEEADAQANLETLVNITTAAITAGNTDAVPAERKPQNSIFVKTGEFEEVLPIIIPENTAVIGDELRSTRIKPAAVLVDSTDTPYTLDGYFKAAINYKRCCN